LNYKATYNVDQTRKVITYLSKFICGEREKCLETKVVKYVGLARDK